MARDSTAFKLIAQNKNASFNYFIEDIYHAGIVLVGTEVKSLRNAKCSIRDSFVQINNSEAFIINMHISSYKEGNIFNLDPLRTRKLLLHKAEINKLQKAKQLKGYSIIPTKIYLQKHLIKIDIALARGKKLFDKRQDTAKKTARREIARAFKSNNLRIK
jgi:SsrA-binding protein